MDMGPGGTYHILSQGGVDRGGVTGHLAGGAPPHWLPYVFVDDPDATIARARKFGVTIPMTPEDRNHEAETDGERAGSLAACYTFKGVTSRRCPLRLYFFMPSP